MAIKLNNHEKFFLKKFERESKFFTSGVSKGINLKMLPNFIIEGVIFLAITIFIIFKILLSDSIEITILFEFFLPILTLLGLVMIKLKPSINVIFESVSSFREGFSVLNKLNEEFNLKSNIINLSNTKNIKFKDKIQLVDISFKYPNTTTNVIYNLNLSILRNDFFGIKGNTGSGKSTLINILVGIIDPDKGEVKIDKIKLTSKNKLSWLDIIIMFLKNQ